MLSLKVYFLLNGFFTVFGEVVMKFVRWLIDKMADVVDFFEYESMDHWVETVLLPGMVGCAVIGLIALLVNR